MTETLLAEKTSAAESGYQCTCLRVTSALENGNACPSTTACSDTAIQWRERRKSGRREFVSPSTSYKGRSHVSFFLHLLVRFAQDRSDSSWLSTLPRAPFPAPPSPAPSHTVHVIPPKVPTGNGVAKSPQTVPADGETAALKIEIASLSSECSSLKESVKHLEDTSASMLPRHFLF